MKKVASIARAEYLEAVRSKAFLVALFLMPVLMGGSLAFQAAFHDYVDVADRACLVVDETGRVWDVLERAVSSRNENEIFEADDENGDAEDAGDGAERAQTAPRFVLERYVPDGTEENLALLLSDRVRDEDMHGFLVIPEGVIAGSDRLEYQTDEPTYTDLSGWLERRVSDIAQDIRFADAGVDRTQVASLSEPVRLTTRGLTTDEGEGEIENKLKTFGIPAIAMMILFLLVMTSAPQLMNQVLEEKMQRISEVLVSSVSPFQLMLGKLFGSVGVALTLAFIYLGGLYWATHHFGVSDFAPISAYVWLVVMVVFAMLMYGSLFSALGSACSELRDAQTMMLPAMVIIMIPLFAASVILENPNGTVAQVLTYVPTATPIVFLIRLLAPPGPPAWEIVLALSMCVLTTLALVWASGRIFRIGVLSQGQTPTFRQLAGWIVRS